jgi:RNA polymerase sigma-54 factor
MKQTLQLRVSQHLALTPQLQQSIRLLQLSSIELNQELETVLQDNPLLERIGEESVESSYSIQEPSNTRETQPETHEAQEPLSETTTDSDFDPGDFNPGDNSNWEMSARNANGSPSDDDDTDFSFQEPSAPTLREHLLEQLGLMHLSARDHLLTEILIDTIDEDGYLEQSLDELVELIPDEQEVDLLELQTALKRIQHLDPIGVGARNLTECLALQLQALSGQTPEHEIALVIVNEHLPLLAARDFAKLKKLLACNDDTLRAAQQIIIRLDPRPGALFSYIESDHYIQPEVVVKKVKGLWLASLNNEAVPKLRINRLYADILKRNRDSSAQYLMSQMQEAKWFIKNIQQRFATILRVSQAIVDRQRSFFEHGDVAMRPLVLREIADELELHESTISRVTTRKYMLTPRGVYELKYFFGSHVATETGGVCSATAIRALLKQLISAENPKKPLSDSHLTDILGEQGIVVARRTVAKYRESLQIPAASQRKTL